MSFTDIAAIVGAFVILVGLIAAAFGVRPALTKMANTVKDDVIATQEKQITAQDRRIKYCEEEARRTKRELYAVRYLFKQMGYYTTVEDGFVSAFDVSQKVTHTTQIRPLHRLDGPDEDKSDETQEDVS